tara:strand:+ start:82 stop:489 length:408 start_codon:yes stop_codon:yes gene_type:complete
VKNRNKNGVSKMCYLYTKHRDEMGTEQLQLNLAECIDYEAYSTKNYFNHVYDKCGTNLQDGDIRLIPIEQTRIFFKSLKEKIKSEKDAKKKMKKIIKEYKNAKYRMIVGHNYEKIDKVNKKVPVRFKNNFTYMTD